MSLNSSVRLNSSVQGGLLQRPVRPPGMSLHCSFLLDVRLCCQPLFIKQTHFFLFSKNKNSVFHSDRNGRILCGNPNRLVEAFGLERVCSQAENFMKLLGFRRAVFQAASSGACGDVSSGTVAWLMWGGFNFSFFPAVTCMETILGLGLELQACLCK